MMEVLTPATRDDLNVDAPTFDYPDIGSFCLQVRLGLTATGQQVGTDRTVLACRVVEPGDITRTVMLVHPVR